jgi:hypothetical protein
VIGVCIEGEVVGGVVLSIELAARGGCVDDDGLSSAGDGQSAGSRGTIYQQVLWTMTGCPQLAMGSQQAAVHQM